MAYVSRFGLSSRRAPTTHTDGRAKGRPTQVVWGFPAAGPLLRILKAELMVSYVGALGPSSRRAPFVYTNSRA